MPTVCRALCCGSHEHSSRLECSLLACFRYLGNDFIFSFIAVALIPVYYARKSVGWLLAALLTVGSFAITTYDIIHYDLGAYVFDDHYRSYAPPRVACTCAAAQRHHLMHRLGTESGVSPLTVCTLVGFTGQVLGHGLLPTMEPHPCVPRRCVRCMGPRPRAREPVEGATFAAEVACNAFTQPAQQVDAYASHLRCGRFRATPSSRRSMWRQWACCSSSCSSSRPTSANSITVGRGVTPVAGLWQLSPIPCASRFAFAAALTCVNTFLCESPDRFENALYLCFGRALWAASLAVISFACVGNTFLPYMNEFLSLYAAHLFEPTLKATVCSFVGYSELGTPARSACLPFAA